jgi:hypothetical protein
VLESEKREREKDLAGAAKTQLGLAHRTNRWCTGQCLVRQASSGELATLGKTSAAYDYNSPDCPVVHRTVRWCTGLSGEPTATSATVGLAIRVRRVAPANGRLGAPDYPVRQPARSCNGRLRQEWKEIAHRT